MAGKFLLDDTENAFTYEDRQLLITSTDECCCWYAATKCPCESGDAPGTVYVRCSITEEWDESPPDPDTRVHIFKCNGVCYQLQISTASTVECIPTDGVECEPCDDYVGNDVGDLVCSESTTATCTTGAGATECCLACYECDPCCCFGGGDYIDVWVDFVGGVVNIVDCDPADPCILTFDSDCTTQAQRYYFVGVSGGFAWFMRTDTFDTPCEPFPVWVVKMCSSGSCSGFGQGVWCPQYDGPDLCCTGSPAVSRPPQTIFSSPCSSGRLSGDCDCINACVASTGFALGDQCDANTTYPSHCDGTDDVIATATYLVGDDCVCEDASTVAHTTKTTRICVHREACCCDGVGDCIEYPDASCDGTNDPAETDCTNEGPC